MTEDRELLRRAVMLAGEIRARRLTVDGHEYGSMWNRSWAWDAGLERLRRLEKLRALARSRGMAAGPSLADLRASGDQLAYAHRLSVLETLADYTRAQARQVAVCAVIGLPWPPVDVVGRLPWRWCWERDDRDLRVVYPGDWLALFQVDQYGHGGRWVRGEVLVLGEDAEPLPRAPYRPVVESAACGSVGRRVDPDAADESVDGLEPEGQREETASVVVFWPEPAWRRAQRLRDEAGRAAGFNLDSAGREPAGDLFGPWTDGAA